MALGGPVLAVGLGCPARGLPQEEALDAVMQRVHLSGGHLVAAPPGYAYEVSFEVWVRRQEGPGGELAVLVQWYPLECEFSVSRGKHRHQDLENSGYVRCRGDSVLRLREGEPLHVGGLDTVFRFGDGWRQDERVAQLGPRNEASVQVKSLLDPGSVATMLHICRPGWLLTPIPTPVLRTLALLADPEPRVAPSEVAFQFVQVLNSSPSIAATTAHSVTTCSISRALRRVRPEFVFVGLHSSAGSVTLRAEPKFSADKEAMDTPSCSVVNVSSVAALFRELLLTEEKGGSTAVPNPKAGSELPECVYLGNGDDEFAVALVSAGVDCSLFLEGGDTKDPVRFLAVFLWYLITLRLRLGKAQHLHFHAFNASRAAFRRRFPGSAAEPRMRPDTGYGMAPSLLGLLPRVDAEFDKTFGEGMGRALP